VEVARALLESFWRAERAMGAEVLRHPGMVAFSSQET
jgi:hypothetical protein